MRRGGKRVFGRRCRGARWLTTHCSAVYLAPHTASPPPCTMQHRKPASAPRQQHPEPASWCHAMLRAITSGSRRACRARLRPIASGSGRGRDVTRRWRSCGGLGSGLYKGLFFDYFESPSCLFGNPSGSFPVQPQKQLQKLILSPIISDRRRSVIDVGLARTVAPPLLRSGIDTTAAGRNPVSQAGDISRALVPYLVPRTFADPYCFRAESRLVAFLLFHACAHV